VYIGCIALHRKITKMPSMFLKEEKPITTNRVRKLKMNVIHTCDECFLL